MLPSDRNRRNYLGFNFSNLRALLRGVSINNLAFTRTPFGTRKNWDNHVLAACTDQATAAKGFNHASAVQHGLAWVHLPGPVALGMLH